MVNKAGLSDLWSMNKNIAFVGKMGSGKTTLAQIFQGMHKYETFSFAKEVKRVGEMILGRSIDKSLDRKLLQQIGQLLKMPFSAMTPEQSMEVTSWTMECKEFSDYFYNNPHQEYLQTPEYYYRVLESSTRFQNKCDQMRAVIDDCRFPKEVELLRKKGNFLIVKLEVAERTRLERLYRSYGNMGIELLLDPSEAEIDSIEADLTIHQK